MAGRGLPLRGFAPFAGFPVSSTINPPNWVGTARCRCAATVRVPADKEAGRGTTRADPLVLRVVCQRQVMLPAEAAMQIDAETVLLMSLSPTNTSPSYPGALLWPDS